MKAKQHDSTIEKPKHLSPWMNTEQAAEYMGCNPITVRRWRIEGNGPKFVTVNRQTIRYHIDEIDAFLRGAKPST